MTVVGICFEWIITFIEITLGHYFMTIFFEKQFSKKTQRIVYFVVIEITTTGVILLNLIDISFSIVTVLFAIIAIAIGSCVLYKGQFVDFLIISLSFITGLNLLEWCYLNTIALIWSPTVIMTMESGFSILRAFIISLAKGIEITVSLILAPLLKKLVLKVEKTKLSMLATVMAFLSSIYLICNLGTGFESELNLSQLVLMIIIVFLLCFFYLCYCLNRIQNEQRFTARQNYFLQKNYELVQTAYHANAELYHDMRNHFLLLQNYLADGKIAEAQNYLEKLSGNKAVLSAERWTGIEAIDYILGQKIASARQQQITVTINAEYPKGCKIEPVDLCAIITNLLDNAIDGAEKCPEYIDKKIDITIRRIHQFVLIRIINSSVTPPVQYNGQLITSKKDKQKHGWGIKSVVSTAEKYNGTVEYNYADFMFSVSVMLFY